MMAQKQSTSTLVRLSSNSSSMQMLVPWVSPFRVASRADFSRGDFSRGDFSRGDLSRATICDDSRGPFRVATFRVSFVLAERRFAWIKIL